MHAQTHTQTNMVMCTMLKRETGHSYFCSALQTVKLMIQRGKREMQTGVEGGRGEESEGVRQMRGQWSVCGVWRSLSKCEGKCVYVVQCVSHVELGFALLTSHTFPPVTKGKYIHTLKCTVIQHAAGCPGCALYALYALYALHGLYECVLSSSECVQMDLLHCVKLSVKTWLISTPGSGNFLFFSLVLDFTLHLRHCLINYFFIFIYLAPVSRTWSQMESNQMYSSTVLKCSFCCTHIF